jgi:tetratricopeptide (TPR) repeat protein
MERAGTMNEPDPTLLAQLAEVLRRRQAEAPEPGRAGLIEELAAAACGEETLLPDIVEAVERSSLGAPAVRTVRRGTPAAVIADVLARAARITVQDDRDGDGEAAAAVRRGNAVPVEGPIPDWLRDVHRLRESRGLDPEKVLVELEGLGFSLTGEQLDDTLTAVPVCPDRELVRSVVTVLGGDWIGVGYEASYDAALDEQRRLHGRLGRIAGPQQISGLAGADPLTPHTLRLQVQADYGLLPPVVRGRDELMDRLVRLLDTPVDRPQVLVGAAGSGKSTVALAVAAAARDRGHRVWWVPAADPNQLTKGLLAVATQLSAPVAELNAIQADPETGAELLWRRMDGSAVRWLLVFAGVDRPEVLDIPGDGPDQLSWLRASAAGTVLATSRAVDGDRWSDAAVHEVGDLPPESGALVLLDRIVPDGTTAGPEQLAQARLISERLGGVALALRAVGSYFGSSVADHDLGELADALDADRPSAGDVVDRLAAIWRMAMTALARRGMPEAHTLIRVLACYAPGRWVVPLSMLTPRRLAASGLAVAPAHTDAEAAWQRALAGLVEIGLVRRKVTDGEQVIGVVLPRLVAEVARSGNAPDADRIEAAAVELLLAERDGLDTGRPADWPALRRLEPHVYALLDNLHEAGPELRARALLLANRVAQGLIRAGLFALGEALIRHAQSRAGDVDPEAEEWLAAEHTLAWALGLRGQLADAELRLRALLVQRRRVHGPEHPDTLRLRDHLAWALAEQGRLEEAQRQFRDLLPTCERVLGPNDRNTLAVRHRMAWITALRGRPDRAEAQFAQLLPRRTEVLGPDHVDVLSNRYRLAWARSRQGRSDVAEADFEALLRDLERVFEPESASVIMVRAQLAIVRTELGRFAAAEADARFVVEARERVLGPHHPRTLWARIGLARFLMHKGDHQTAERMLREVLAEVHRTPELGKDHPLSLEARGRLCRLLVAAGRLDEAVRSARTLLMRRQRVSGWEHPSTLADRYLVALGMMRRGQLGEAEFRLEAVLVDQERLLGPDNHHTLGTRAALAELLGRRGMLAESHAAVVEVLKSRSAVLGPHHVETMDSRERLVWILAERNRLAEAEACCRELVADCAGALGPWHPDTLSARYRLAWLLGLAHRGPEAERRYRELVADQHRALGREHPHTLRSRHGLARELLRAGRPAEAEQQLRSVLIDRIHVLGRRHPDTLTNRHWLAMALAVQGTWDDAERSMQAVLTEQLAVLGPDHRHTLLSRERLVWIQEQQGALADAERKWQRLLRDRERLFGPDHPDTIRIRERLGRHSHQVPLLW